MADKTFEIADLQDNRKRLATGVIEFGSVSSVVGFSFANESRNIWIKSLTYDDILNDDVPNCILLKPDGKTVHSFGYEAEKEYIELVGDKLHKDYYFFKGLKGIEGVEEKEPGRQITMTDESGKYVSAVYILSLMLQNLAKQVTSQMPKVIEKSDIYWVICVPPCSSPCFIKTMNDSAKKAGFDVKSFVVITSADAAALLFNNLHDYTTSTIPYFRLQPGMQFITVIAEEETVDTVVHSLETDGKIKEICSLKRCNWGVNMVVKEFESMLANITGTNVLEVYKKEQSEDWMELVRDFYQKVRLESLKGDLDRLVSFRFPNSFRKLVQQLTGKSLKDAIESSKYKDSVFCTGDKIRITLGVFRSLFDITLQQITSHIRSVIQGLDIQPKALLLVGRFVDIPIFQNTIKEALQISLLYCPKMHRKQCLKVHSMPHLQKTL